MYRFKTPNQKKTDKFIGFDLDGTLIETKSGLKFAKDKNDWKLRKNIKDKLQMLSEGIIIITNQNGNNFDIEEFKEKLRNIYKELKVSFRVYIACRKDRFRKPNTGFYDEYIYKKGTLTCYIGDAAGRKGDHSDVDYKYSINLNIPFYTPEEYFNGKDNKEKTINYPRFDRQIEIKFDIPKSNLIILVGRPGSGKTWFCENYLPKYKRVNQDELKTKAKCLKMCEELMKNEKKIVIDNTNPTKEIREQYIELAKQYNYKYEIIHISTPIEICKHNMMKRQCEKDEEFIPDIAYNVFKGKFDDDNITEIINLPLPKFDKYYY